MSSITDEPTLTNGLFYTAAKRLLHIDDRTSTFILSRASPNLRSVLDGVSLGNEGFDGTRHPSKFEQKYARLMDLLTFLTTRLPQQSNLHGLSVEMKNLMLEIEPSPL
ncbi:unnamed protein product [Dibothriocephalus latus]|uniref:Uncharacterized protein n=1 Tax=Dibothriocephalus latus TaxID=60516 RepID=A0A3P7P7J4_DIBLA|nr:unnamed protein product [Dibothriocephalus latus]